MDGRLQRLWRAWRMWRSPRRLYSPAAYAVGALLPGPRTGAGPVAWLRGLPMPDLRPGTGALELGHVALYPGVRLHCRGTGRIVIGDGSFLNRNVRVFAAREVTLGAECMVSWQTVITDFAGFDAAEPFAPVTIEDHVWIGCRVVILGGTRLGRGCVVAAGSVVQGVYPAGALVAGRPADITARTQDLVI